MKFPRLVYKAADVHKCVENEDDFILAMDDGYFATVPEALIGQHDAVYTKEPELEELEVLEPVIEQVKELHQERQSFNKFKKR